ncbi:MAG: ECF-type sigma factor [Phycisphaerales bacterium]
MSDSPHKHITRLVADARNGDAVRRERLYDAIYDELRLIARGATKQRTDFQATELVHELFIEFERRFPAPPAEMPESRRTFFQSVALAMRQIVRDHARAANAQKRGGSRHKLELRDDLLSSGLQSTTAPEALIDLDHALDALEQYNDRWAEVVLHRVYAGRTIDQTASMMSRSASGVSRDWALAKAWIARHIERCTEPSRPCSE